MIKKIFKAFSVLLIIGAVGIGSLIGYHEYQDNQREKFELTYLASHDGWMWHEGYDRVQIRYQESTKRHILRRVDLKNKYVVYAIKNDDYSLSTMVAFEADCEPMSEIITTKKFSSGNKKTLICDEEGVALQFMATWNDSTTDVTWEDNLDGYEFSVRFNSWNFNKLDQEITLSKANSSKTTAFDPDKFLSEKNGDVSKDVALMTDEELFK